MYTDASKHLEKLLSDFDRADYPAAFKKRIRPELDFFLRQALCDLDRRVSQGELRTRWNALQVAVKGTKVLGSLMFNNSARHSIQSFVGIATVEPYMPPAKTGPPKSRFQDYEPNQMIEHLLMKCSSRPRITEAQAVLVKVGLFYLQAEASRARSQRNASRMREVWALIQPLLRDGGFLLELCSDREAVKRFRNFLSNRVF